MVARPASPRRVRPKCRVRTPRPDPTLSAEQLLLSRKEVTPMRKLIIAIAVLSSFLTACATMPIPAKDAPVFFDHQ